MPCIVCTALLLTPSGYIISEVKQKLPIYLVLKKCGQVQLRLFADTRHASTWLIYHNALPQWWEMGTQDYLALQGFTHRQCRARGTANALVVPYYLNRLMGDSLELMPLDSPLFGDVIEKVAWLIMTMVNISGEGRYTMGIPGEAWRAMVVAWELMPETRDLVGHRVLPNDRRHNHHELRVLC